MRILEKNKRGTTVATLTGHDLFFFRQLYSATFDILNSAFVPTQILPTRHHQRMFMQTQALHKCHKGKDKQIERQRERQMNKAERCCQFTNSEKKCHQLICLSSVLCGKTLFAYTILNKTQQERNDDIERIIDQLVRYTN